MDPRAPAEQILLFVLIAASAAAFWLRFAKVLRVVRASKPEPGYRLAPLGPRVRRFLWEVVLQGQVIRQRPWAGVAHAFVFWGFCAFALVTVHHIALGFNAVLLAPGGWFGRAYFAAAAAFAALVAASIAGLAIRRFLVRPKWLGPVSYESGFIALLIFTLMATYLADYARHADGGAGPAVWWLHTISLLVFLPLIPHTKHLHLVLSPFTVFLEREGFSQIPPLEGDEDFGLVSGKDVTNIVALQAYSCVECGRCTEHCPANLTGKELNPKQIILGVRTYLNEHGANAEAPLLGPHLSQEAAYQCTTCGSCEYQCPVGIQHLPVIAGLRRGATNTGQWEDSHGTKLFLNLERHGNPMGFAAGERQKFLDKHQLPLFDGSQEYCLWLGCMGSYDPQGREIVLALVDVLRHTGVTFGVLKKERCTGDAARRLGNDLLFGELAARNMETLEAAGARKLLSICPHCVRTLGVDYREFGAAIEMVHHSELLARLRDKLPRAAAGGGTAVFHDPCYLGRYRGVYDAPRQVAALGGKLIEPPRARDRSFCCGAGGGLAFLGEEKGQRVNMARAEELAATGAAVVAAACPFCRTMFQDAFKGAADPPRLLDIAEIAAAGLPERPPAA